MTLWTVQGSVRLMSGAVCLTLLSSLATAGDSAGAASPPVTLPAETELAVRMLSGLHSRVNHAGDPVAAVLRQPVFVGGELALPVDTLLFGRVTRVRPARRLHRRAELTVHFEKVALPDGETEPIHGVLVAFGGKRQLKTRLDPEGYLKGAGPLSEKRTGAGVTLLAALATLKVALPHSAAASVGLPVGGAALVAYLLIWPKGNEVHVPPETPCRIRLVYPLTVHAVT